MATIGSIRTSGRSVNAGGPRLTTDFGAGVGRALENASQSLAAYEDSNINLADEYEDKQRRKQKAEAEIAWIKKQTELDQQLTEFSKQRSADPTNFTNDYDTILRQQNEAFVASLPEYLQDEFRVRTEQYGRGLISEAFGFENETVNQVFLSDFVAIRNTMLDEILQGNSTVEEVLPALQNIYDTAPLDAFSNEKLQTETLQLLKKAELQTLVLEELRTPELSSGTTGGPSDGSDVVASGLSGPARAVLNAIASTESPGYNVMYGGATFSDYSRHPNQAQKIQSGPNEGKFSTAAGRYQFIYSTWMEAKNALNLPDFSPESQDRAAIWLAKRDYYSRTGRDLEADIGTGDPAILANVRAALGPTWEGLTKISNEDFASLFGAEAMTGTTSSIINDPQYEDISYIERMEIYQAAQKQSLAEMKAASDARLAEQQAALNALIFGIRNGENITQSQIDAFSNEQKLGLSDRDKLQKEFDEQNETNLTVQSVSNKLANPHYIFNKADDRQAVNTWSEQTLIPLINNGDIAAIENQVLPAIQRLGFVPQNVGQLLTAASGSQNRQIATFSLETLAKMRAINPTAFDNSFAQNSRARSDTLFFDRARRLNMSDEEIWEEMNKRRDPEYLRVSNEFEKAAEANITKSQEKGGQAEMFTASKIGRAIGVDDIEDPSAFRGVYGEFRANYINEFIKYRDHDAAYEAAAEIVAANWGRSSVNGGRVMKYPPERSTAVQSLFDSFDWMDTAIRQDMNIPEGTNYKLVSDKHTQQNFENGTPPRYQIAIEQNGVWMPMMNPERPGVPELYQFETPEEVTETLREQNVRDRQIAQLEQELQSFTSSTVPEGSIVNLIAPGLFKGMNNKERNARVKELRQQIWELRLQSSRPGDAPITAEDYMRASPATGGLSSNLGSRRPIIVESQERLKELVKAGKIPADVPVVIDGQFFLPEAKE